MSGTARGEGSRVAYVSVVESIPPYLAVTVEGSSTKEVDVVPRQKPERRPVITCEHIMTTASRSTRMYARILIDEEQALRRPFRNVGGVLN